MLRKIWEVAALVIVVSLAARLLLSILAPLLPIIITVAVILSIVGTLVHRKRNW